VALFERELAKGAPTKKATKASIRSKAGSKAISKSKFKPHDAAPLKFRRAERPSKTPVGLELPRSAKKESGALVAELRTSKDPKEAGVIEKDH
jgi:hypothetical protein